MQLFWFVPTNDTIWLKYEGLEMDAEKALALTPQPQVLASSIGNTTAKSTSPTQLPLSYSHAPQQSLAPGTYIHALDDGFAQ